jgi:predicted transcriptional regulator YdeE
MKPDILLMTRNLGIGELYVSGEMVLQMDVRRQEAMHMVGIEVFCPFGIGTPGVDNPGIAWERFHPVKHTVPGTAAPEQTFGVAYKPSDGGFYYLAAIRVNGPGSAPEGMVAYTLPEGLYAACIYQNESFETGVNINLSNAIAFFHKWLDENGYRTLLPMETEYYGAKAFVEPYQIELWRKVEKA